MHRLSIPPRDRYTELMAQVQTRTALSKAWSVSVSDSDTAKISCVTASGEKKKVVVMFRESMVCV
jgi:hypothetical protein